MSVLTKRLLQWLSPNNARTALIDSQGTSTSYASLLEQVQHKSTLLTKCGVEPGQRVVLNLPKSVDQVAWILAILNHESLYVPIDPGNPETRKSLIYQDASPALIVSHEPISIQGYERQAAHLYVNSEGTKSPGANILYTSGSTGVPKGVIGSVEGLDAFVNWAIQEFGLSENDRLVSFAPFHFDLSTFDLFAGLSAGASIWLVDDKLATNFRLLGESISQIKPTIWYATPTVLTLMTSYARLSSVDTPRLILFAGEVFPVSALNELRAIWNTTYFNLYGPTETNVCTYYKLPVEIEHDRTAPYPIGVACPYARIEVTNDGEVIVSGPSVMHGYTGSDLTTTRVETGDIVVVEEGLMVYQGRRDRMIKRHGYRIEPAEVETVLLGLEGLETCVVIMLDRLVAFYSGQAHSDLNLKTKSALRLPSYMIPDTFIHIAELPLTASGKVDHQRLKAHYEGSGH